RDLAHRGAHSKDRPSASANSASISRVDSPRAYISTASASSSSVRPRMISRNRERNGTARSGSAARRSPPHLPRSSADPRGSRCDSLRPALVIVSSQRVGGFSLQAFLDDHGKPHQL